MPDFPFASDSDRTNAIALMMTPFAREFTTDPSPLHVLEASTPGSGKTLLAWLLNYPAFGEGGVRIVSAPDDEAEMGKLLVSVMTGGTGAVVFDNLRGTLDSGVLSNVLTSRHYDGRILGTNQTADATNDLSWCLTANNPALSTELTRRCLRSRLIPDTDRPELRTGFRHENIKTWARENRGNLIWAALVLVRHWIQEGRPQGAALGSFESWAATMGGILGAAGYAGFRENYNDFLDSVDSERNARAAFCHAWFQRHGAKSVSSGDLVALVQAEGIEGLPAELNARSMGRYLAQHTDTRPQYVEFSETEPIREVFSASYQICRGKLRGGKQQWRLVQLWRTEGN